MEVRDNQGRKIGTVGYADYSWETCLTVIVVIAAIVGGIVWGITSCVSQIVHPTIQNWISYSAKDAHVSGSARPSGDTDGIKLNTGASIEFDVSVPSDDHYSVSISEFYHETYRESVIVNGNKFADLVDRFNPVLTVDLNKGTNTIKIINNTSVNDTSLPDIDVLSISIKTY